MEGLEAEERLGGQLCALESGLQSWLAWLSG